MSVAAPVVSADELGHDGLARRTASGSLRTVGHDERSLGRLAERATTTAQTGYCLAGLMNAVRSALRGERHASEGPSKEP